jgi:hypothetical protein
VFFVAETLWSRPVKKMCTRIFSKIIRQPLIKIILVLSLIVLSWLVLKRLFPPPITFWHVVLRNGTSPLPQELTLSFKLAFLKNCSLIITVCGRNVESHLSVFRWNIENIASLFGEYHIFIGESDSTDKTLIYLRQWSEKNDRVTIKTYGNLSHSIAGRSDRIAYCRNDLLDEARSTDLFRLPKHTFYMVADADTNTRLNRSIFLSNFDYLIDEWGAMTASQYSGYYDIWALRNDVVNYDCWHIVHNLLVIFVTFNRVVEIYINIHQKSIPSNHSLIPVNSAFGGAAIYQIKYLNECRYSGYESFAICEHVSFNLCVTRNGGKIFINPKFQID